MPTQDAVFHVADTMLAAGEVPSLRKVTAKLRNCGSPRVVCRHLRAWRKQRGYNPKLDAKDLSVRLREHLMTLGRDAYRIAQEDAALGYVREREKAEAIRRAELEDHKQLLGLLEAAEAGNAALLARAEAAKAEAARVVVRLTKVENQLDRFRAEEFWDRVMREIYEILPVAGSMAPGDILPELRKVTVRGATLHREPLTAGVL